MTCKLESKHDAYTIDYKDSQTTIRRPTKFEAHCNDEKVDAPSIPAASDHIQMDIFNRFDRFPIGKTVVNGDD
jgi:hypothetical protein